jgi:hypothetical protein
LTIEEVLGSTTLKDVLPVLSLETKRILTEDLERVAKAPNNKQNHGLRQVYLSVKSIYEHDAKRLELIDAKLDLAEG